MSSDAMITHLVGATALILIIAHTAGWLSRRLGQPTIIGQLIAGIALGPTMLAEISPQLSRTLFPPALAPVLTGLAQIALVLFLFAVGYELDLRVLQGRARSVVAVSLAGFLLPMAAGCGAAVLFHDQLAELGAPERMTGSSVLFLGVALSITAVPVLTAIVREKGLAGTVPGIVAVSAAGLIDVMGWTVLIGTLLQSDGHGGLSWLVRLLILLVFMAVMLFGARPVLRRLLWRAQVDPSLRLAVLVGFAFASAWVTNALGLHVIFGALLAGVVTPRERGGTLDPDLVRPLHDIGLLLLPFFFVVSGKSVEIGALDSDGVVAMLLVTVLAVAIKVVSGTVAARLSGLDRHDARTVGVLLNTRGLTELIALNVGLQAGLVSGRLYTALVLMALATTVITQPLLVAVRRLREREERTAATPQGTRPPAEAAAQARPMGDAT
ncbi:MULTISPECIES: cation:proton antiporter [unclassified Streptomyces]|uniref:cation:proton antiporter n=1 Tax=unclassified Streptomyces TaxID=2593676 RepID=UPI0022569BD3|nr:MULTISPECIES: cation:proton antiporter [unclassified Streptomyces]MCX4528799.1 cation:proton antiporter [Streptomyces sp. NBC_01551]MCX4540593.1 cation:proton antiporter [Streptomyces sp. NBC_01565]